MANSMISSNRCSKADPKTCRLHKHSKPIDKELFHAELLAEQERKETMERNNYTKRILKDLRASWKTETDANGVTTCSVYRSGNPTPPKERGVELETYINCDKFLPEGRQGRMSAVFAAPTYGGAARWFRANAFLTSNPDILVRELRINIDETYVYSVAEWERASNSDQPRLYQKYWDNGITMREYMDKAQLNPTIYCPEEYELLIPKDRILAISLVGKRELMQYAYSKAEDINAIFKRFLKK